MAEAYSPFKDASWYPAVAQIFKGVPESIWGPIIQVESGGNPYAVGDQGRSFGLFQLFTAGGLGDAYKDQPKALFDPALNAQLAASSLKPVFAEASKKSLTGFALLEYVASHSGWPLQTGNMPDSYRQKLQEAYTTYGQTSSGANPPPVGSIGRGQLGSGTPALLTVLRNLDQLESSQPTLLTPGDYARKIVVVVAIVLVGLILTGVGLVALVGGGSVVKLVTDSTVTGGTQ